MQEKHLQVYGADSEPHMGLERAEAAVGCREFLSTHAHTHIDTHTHTPKNTWTSLTSGVKDKLKSHTSPCCMFARHLVLSKVSVSGSLKWDNSSVCGSAPYLAEQFNFSDLCPLNDSSTQNPPPSPSAP